MTSGQEDQTQALGESPQHPRPAAHGAPLADSSPADLEAAATVEAILFAADTPLPAAKIAEIAELPGQRAVKQAVALLNSRYESQGSAIRIEAIAGGYQMLTRPEYHDVVSRLQKDRGESRLSQAALETLAIVAYRQPVLRADIEAIRGVACGEVLRSLLERQLIKIVARAEVIGRPMLYGTTRRFLEVFGLSSLDELPQVAELASGARAQPGRSSPGTVQAPAQGPQQGDGQPPDAPAARGDA